MTLTVHPLYRLPKARAGLAGACLPGRQHGVVLLISLILLVVISLLAVTSMRNAGSSESVASNVRTTALATEAAEIALRSCESKALAMATSGVTPVSTPDQWKTPGTWDNPSTWAVTSTSAYVLLLTDVNPPSLRKTYQRPPECMVEKQSVLTTDASTFYVITARGFGPEVAPADPVRRRPKGTEVWLQSHIQIN